MRTLLLDVPDAHCGACRASIVTTLLGLLGVLAADVDLRHRLTTVTFDDGMLSRAALLDALTAAGYPPS